MKTRGTEEHFRDEDDHVTELHPISQLGPIYLRQGNHWKDNQPDGQVSERQTHDQRISGRAEAFVHDDGYD